MNEKMECNIEIIFSKRVNSNNFPNINKLFEFNPEPL